MAQNKSVVVAAEEEAGGDSPDEAKAETLAAEATEPAVVYTGKAPVRIVRREEFEKAGVTEQDTATWTRQNKHSVKKSAFTEAALNVLLQDPAFKVVGE
jgi:hypothetical protein